MAKVPMNKELSALWEYWKTKRGDRPMPARKDFDPVEIPKLLPHISLLENIDGRLRFRLVGRTVADAYGFDIKGKFLEDVFPKKGLEIAQRSYTDALETGRLLISRGDLVTPKGVAFIVTRLLLPLCDGAGRVTFILAGVTFEYRSAHRSPSLGAGAISDDLTFQMEFL